MTFIHNLAKVYSRRRFACLFFSLLTSLVAAPVFGAMGLSTTFMEVFLALNIWRRFLSHCSASGLTGSGSFGAG